MPREVTAAQLRRESFLVYGAFLFVGGIVWSVLLILVYGSFLPLAANLAEARGTLDQWLKDHGVDPEDQSGLIRILGERDLDASQARSLVQRCLVAYGEIERGSSFDLDLGCRVFTFRSPLGAANATYKAGVTTVFLPGIVQCILLTVVGLLGLVAGVRRPQPPAITAK